ncbi:MAG: hypothetical protein ACIAS6_12240 [Phycisphaerales bacterium JB060]
MRCSTLATGLSTGPPQTRSAQDGSERWYVLQNWRQDVVAVIDEAAVQRDRVFFRYGVNKSLAGCYRRVLTRRKPVRCRRLNVAEP